MAGSRPQLNGMKFHMRGHLGIFHSALNLPWQEIASNATRRFREWILFAFVARVISDRRFYAKTRRKCYLTRRWVSLWEIDGSHSNRHLWTIHFDAFDFSNNPDGLCLCLLRIACCFCLKMLSLFVNVASCSESGSCQGNPFEMRSSAEPGTFFVCIYRPILRVKVEWKPPHGVVCAKRLCGRSSSRDLIIPRAMLHMICRLGSQDNSE